jgi:NAD-dependent deacetylase
LPGAGVEEIAVSAEPKGLVISLKMIQMDANSSSLDRAAGWLRSANEVVVFTGAGVSAESDIPTFRDEDGFWQRFPVGNFATWQGILRSAIHRPRQLAEFLYSLIYPIAAAKPNNGHLAIAELENHVGITVVTQNIDNLHQDAGSTIVLEIHGSFFEIVNRKGRFIKILSRKKLLAIGKHLDRICRCKVVLPQLLTAIHPLAGLGFKGFYYPRLVLFGDALAEPAWTRALDAVRHCDCMIQVGTSGMVMPAAMLPLEAKDFGAKIITIDPHEGQGDVWLRGTAATILPQLVRRAFKGSI